MRRHLNTTKIAAASLFLFLLAASALAQSSAQLDGFVPQPTADVHDIAVRPDGKIFLGGSFLNGDRPRLALLRADGVTDIGFNANVTDGWVNAVEPQNDGKVLVGGSFTSIGGVTQARLARLNSSGGNDGSISAVPNGEVRTICIQADNKIVFGGDFTMVGTTVRNRIARLNADGSLDTGFDPNADGVLYTVACDRVNGKIYVGGLFTTIGGIQRRIVRLNANGSVDLSFNYGGASSESASAFALQADGRIVVGHSSGVRRVNPDGSLDPSLSYGTSSWVNSVATQPDGGILIAGFFASIASVPRNNVARLNRNGSLDTGFDPNVASPAPNVVNVRALAVQYDGKILIGGRFQTVGGIARNSIARVYQDGAIDDHADPNFGGGPISTIVPLPDGSTMVAGNMSSIGGTPISELAMLTTRGTRNTSFNGPTFAGGWVNQVVADPSYRYLVGGDFTSVNGSAARKHLVRLDAAGGIDTSFNIDLNGSIFGVIRLSNGQYLIGGAFTTVNGVAKNRIAKINNNGTLDAAFNPSADFWVDCFALQSDGKILVGGIFTAVNGMARTGLARLNADGTLDTTFDVTLQGLGEVYDIVIQPDGKILFGGVFTGVNGTARTHLARINANGTLDTAFNPVLDGSVLSIALDQDGNVVFGGHFTNVNGSPRQRIMRVHSSGASDVFFVADSPDTVLAVAVQTDGKVMAGGYFSTINGTARNRFVRLRERVAAITDISAGPNSVTLNHRQAAPDVSRVEFYTSVDGMAWSLLGSAVPTDFFRTWTLTGVQPQAFVRAVGYGRDHSADSPTIDVKRWVPEALPLPHSGAPFGFAGDGKTDIGITRDGSDKQWWINRSTAGLFATPFGTAADIVAPADFTGDGKTDIAFFRQSTGFWYVLRSEDQTFYAFPFGANGDVPVPGDFDGDGKADAAVFRPSNSTWYQLLSGGGSPAIAFGAAGDKPVVADYDGDGKSDIAIFRPSGGSGSAEWWMLRSTAGLFAVAFGSSTDKAVPGDYTGDGKADVAFWRPSSGSWFVLRSENLSFYAFPWGGNGDIPAPGDYDGDGKYDAAVFRPSEATWYISRTTAGVLITAFGANGDRPIPNAFVP